MRTASPFPINRAMSAIPWQSEQEWPRHQVVRVNVSCRPDRFFSPPDHARPRHRIDRVQARGRLPYRHRNRPCFVTRWRGMRQVCWFVPLHQRCANTLLMRYTFADTQGVLYHRGGFLRVEESVWRGRERGNSVRPGAAGTRRSRKPDRKPRRAPTPPLYARFANCRCRMSSEVDR